MLRVMHAVMWTVYVCGRVHASMRAKRAASVAPVSNSKDGIVLQQLQNYKLALKRTHHGHRVLNAAQHKAWADVTLLST